MAYGDIHLDPTVEKLNKLQQEFDNLKDIKEIMIGLKDVSEAYEKSSMKLLRFALSFSMGAMVVSMVALFRASL